MNMGYTVVSFHDSLLRQTKFRDVPVTQQSDKNARANSMGTFAGVFTPSILTILGIILFLRLGYVVGSAGLWRALVIIGLANAISVLTSISLSAVATNFKVKGGGVYYLISRTLGIEFGGAIGIVLFLAQAVSIAFYCLGLGEVVGALWPDGPAWRVQLVALVAVSCLFVLAWLGADWATRFQYVVMAVLGAALLSFFMGGLPNMSLGQLAHNWAAPGDGAAFWVLFAIFFPAVTGFTQGVSMSGDLREPERSLHLGTLWAVGISIVVYFGAALVLAAVLPLSDLAADYQSIKKVSLFHPLVDAGVIAATVSSAMASFLGAPRILQSLAADKIFKLLNPFAMGAGPANNPRRGVLLTAAIAYAAVGFGQINLIAPVVSMFFLISYGLLNYATYYEANSKSPSFRPRFRWFDYRLSLLGGLACLGIMLAIDPASGAVATALLFALHQYLKRLELPLRWADSQQSHHMQEIRGHLISAGREVEHPRNWRPQVLALSVNPQRRERLVRFAHWMEGGSGIVTLVRLVEAQGAAMPRVREKAVDELAGDILAGDLPAFPMVVVAPDLDQGLQVLVQAYGVGPLKANLVLVNWSGGTQESDNDPRRLRYGSSLRGVFRLGYNVVVLSAREEQWKALAGKPAADRRIDVWWSGDATSRLMLLLAYITTRSPFWEGASIRVIDPGGQSGIAQEPESLGQLLEDYRIQAEPVILKNPDPESLANLCRDSSMLFLPFKLVGNLMQGPFGEDLADLLENLPVTGLVLAGTDVDLSAEPDEGKAAEVAEALDAMQKAEERLRQAEKDEKKARKDMEAKKAAATETGGLSGEETEEALRQAEEAEQTAQAAFRRVAKEQAKLEDNRRQLEQLGVKQQGQEKDEPSADQEREGADK
jgi:amino acid transporter